MEYGCRRGILAAVLHDRKSRPSRLRSEKGPTRDALLCRSSRGIRNVGIDRIQPLMKKPQYEQYGQYHRHIEN